MTGLLARLHSDERGAAIPEFAFILLPLVLFLAGGMDLGYQAYLRSVLQGALNDISRSGSLETPDVGCTGATLELRIECAIEKRSNVLARNARYDVEIKNFYDFSSIGRSERLTTDHNGNGAYDPGDCFIDLNENGRFDMSAGRAGVGGADDVSFYKVTARMPRLFPIHRLIETTPEYAIVATAALRNQPYAAQRRPPTVCV
ncbi:TadE/TadG family type IV pilus assembly protein [Qipengyuania spongiae]|uniref:Pilus assembly protein n=1 Tax=Qipengyuania spongiae TaxID=2909673 RepID=A0ABY5T0C9_9SPHN|nr:TadE family protein [Qipengyuania spongiae]UVI38706.1 pilus assembly protein [Qipengyuania spongiae]